MVRFFKSGVWDKVPEGSALIFADTRISLKHSVGVVEGSHHTKNWINPFIRFDRTLTCDRHGHRPGYRAIL